MIDLHTHILFDIDDGAESIEDSLAILSRAEKMGITKAVVTPHFTLGDDVESFLKKRKERTEQLKEELSKNNISIELCEGAEVYITDEIYNETRLKELTIGTSGVMLSEFKYHSLKIDKFLDYIEEILFNNVKVLIAHPERYTYLYGRERLIDMLINRGVRFQVNAISLYEEGEAGDFARMMVTSGRAFAVGSDIHHARSKRLDAMAEFNKSEKWRRLLWDNPSKIFTGEVN